MSELKLGLKRTLSHSTCTHYARVNEHNHPHVLLLQSGGGPGNAAAGTSPLDFVTPVVYQYTMKMWCVATQVEFQRSHLKPSLFLIDYFWVKRLKPGSFQVMGQPACFSTRTAPIDSIPFPTPKKQSTPPHLVWCFFVYSISRHRRPTEVSRIHGYR